MPCALPGVPTVVPEREAPQDSEVALEQVELEGEATKLAVTVALDEPMVKVVGLDVVLERLAPVPDDNVQPVKP